MVSKQDYSFEDGKKIQLIDLPRLNKLEKNLLKNPNHIKSNKIYHVSLENHSVSVSYNDPIREAFRKGLETAALDFYKKNFMDKPFNYQSKTPISDDNHSSEYNAPEIPSFNYQNQINNIFNYQSDLYNTSNQAYIQQRLMQKPVYNPSNDNQIDYTQKISNSNNDYTLPEDSCCKKGVCFGYC